MAKNATAKEEEERKKDLFSQKEQRKRRVEVWEDDENHIVFEMLGNTIIKDNNLLKNDIIKYFEEKTMKVFTKDNYYIGELPDIEEFKEKKRKEVIINKVGLERILTKHKEQSQETFLEMFNILKNKNTEIYYEEESDKIYFFMKNKDEGFIDMGLKIKDEENYMFHYLKVNPKYKKRKINRKNKKLTKIN